MGRFFLLPFLFLTHGLELRLSVFLHHVGAKLVQEFDEMFVRGNDVLDVHHGLLVDFHDKETVLSELDHIFEFVEFIEVF